MIPRLKEKIIWRKAQDKFAQTEVDLLKKIDLRRPKKRDFVNQVLI